MTSTVRLADPDTFAAGPPHEALAELRRSDPVCWQALDGEAGFFAVLRYDDVLHVSREPILFSASEGGITLEDPTLEALAMSRDMLVVMGPPETHPLPQADGAELQAEGDRGARGPAPPDLPGDHGGGQGGRAGRRVRPSGQRFAAGAGHGSADGSAAADWPLVHRLSEQMLASQDPDVAPSEAEAEGVTGPDQAAVMQLAGYAMNFAAERRRAELLPDVTSVLLTEDFDGRQLSDLDFASFFVQLVGPVMTPRRR